MREYLLFVALLRQVPGYYIISNGHNSLCPYFFSGLCSVASVCFILYNLKYDTEDWSEILVSN
jgi:hypothetical protein